MNFKDIIKSRNTINSFIDEFFKSRYLDEEKLRIFEDASIRFVDILADNGYLIDDNIIRELKVAISNLKPGKLTPKYSQNLRFIREKLNEVLMEQSEAVGSVNGLIALINYILTPKKAGWNLNRGQINALRIGINKLNTTGYIIDEFDELDKKLKILENRRAVDLKYEDQDDAIKNILNIIRQILENKLKSLEARETKKTAGSFLGKIIKIFK